MIIYIKGVELEIPDGSTIETSYDGRKMKIQTPPGSIQEKIRIVEVPVESPVNITFPIPQPLPHWPYGPTWTYTGGTGPNIIGKWDGGTDRNNPFYTTSEVDT